MIGEPLPTGIPEPDIKHVKRLSIYARSSANAAGDATTLTFHIDHQPEKGSSPGDDPIDGYELQDGEDADTIIKTFLTTSRHDAALLPTPLDFPIGKKCYVVFKLVGDFWEFELDDAVTTKQKHGNDRYYQLVPYPDAKGRLAAVGFCVKAPFKGSRDLSNHTDFIRHGINLAVRFISDDPKRGPLRLPVIIDPDVENRGG
jgi:hypothetical protein